MVVNTGKGLHETDFIALNEADTILVVLQLDLITVRNTTRLLKFLRQDPEIAAKIRLVSNRENSHPTEVGFRRAEEVLGAPWSSASRTRSAR